MSSSAPINPFHAAGPATTFKAPLTIDSILGFLDHTAFHPLAALLLWPILGYLRHNAALHPALSIIDLLKQSLATEKLFDFSFWRAVFKHHPRLALYPSLFILIKTLNKLLNRWARNNGQFWADRPDWRGKNGKVKGGEIVLITGGATGIGMEIVEDLVRRKGIEARRVVVLDLAEPTYKVRGVTYFKCDVSDQDAVAVVAKEIRAKVGNPTILINNAGIATAGPILSTDVTSFQKVLKVNTFSHIVILREFLPHLIKINHGHVVSVASSASYLAIAYMVEYAMSKAASLAAWEILRAELRSRYFAPKVRTTVCCPTKVRTALGDGMEDAPMPFIAPTLDAWQVAHAINDAIDSGLSHHLMMPAFTNVLPLIRGVPDWVKRVFEIIGKTDHTVTTKTMSRSLSRGYGRNIQDEELHKMYESVKNIAGVNGEPNK